MAFATTAVKCHSIILLSLFIGEKEINFELFFFYSERTINLIIQ